MNELGEPLRDSPSAFRRYGLAAGCVVSSVLLRWLLDPVLDSYLPLATIYGFVAVTVWYGGWQPALLTVVAGYLAGNWLFIPPRYEFSFPVKELWGLAMYVFSCGVLIVVGEATRRAKQEAHRSALTGIERQHELEREILERKRVEDQLRRAHQTFIDVVERSPFGIYIVDAQFQIAHMNESGQRGAFRNVKPVIGRDFAEAVHIIWPEPVAADIIRIFRHTLQTGEPYYSNDFIHARADVEQTERYEWELHRLMLADGRYGVICYYFDSTKLWAAEEALRQSERLYHAIGESGNYGVWVCAPDGRNTYVSPSLLNLLGITQEQCSNFGWRDALHPDDAEGTVEAWKECVRTGGTWYRENRFRDVNGQWHHILARGVPVKDDLGRIVCWAGINLDISRLKHTEEQLRESEARLEARVSERTQALLQTQHELRALANELQLTEQRGRQRLAAELHDHLQQMLVLGKIKLSQGQRLAQSIPECVKVIHETDTVLSDALTYTRTLVAELSPPALRHHGLAAGLKWLGESMSKRDLSVTVTVCEGADVGLPEDQADLVFQSVRELLINASKYAGSGQAAVTLEQRDGQLHITVNDYGVGFDVATGTAPLDSPSGGLSSKFGLFSIKERMRALGGSCEIQSKLGQGTKVTLSLPIVGRKKALFPSPDPRQDEGPATPRGTTLKVLLVEDHAMMRQGLRSVLESYADVEVVGEAANGAEAVAIVGRLQPHVVVMDINMPNKNGIEATAEIKSLYPDIRVIGLSVNADADTQAAMLKAGASTLLTKEAAVEQLYTMIRHELDRALSMSSNGGLIKKLARPLTLMDSEV